MSIRELIVRCLLALCLACAAPQAFAQPAAGPSAVQPAADQPAATPDRDYVLGPEDVVEIEVLGRSDFRTRARIGSDGKILLPYLGEVEAANKTPRQLGEDVGRALETGGIFAKPVMRVEVVSFASKYVIVLGAVMNPGLVPVNRPYRLSEIVARVGGIRADGADHVIIRPEKGAERRIDIRAMSTGDVTQDPYVAAGDKIFAPTAEVFYISGQVKAPGSYPVNSEMTFRMAIARGGGLTEMGSERRLKVTRAGQELDRVELDSKVQPGDIVVVGERLF